MQSLPNDSAIVFGYASCQRDTFSIYGEVKTETIVYDGKVAFKNFKKVIVDGKTTVHVPVGLICPRCRDGFLVLDVCEQPPHDEAAELSCTKCVKSNPKQCMFKYCKMSPPTDPFSKFCKIAGLLYSTS